MAGRPERISMYDGEVRKRIAKARRVRERLERAVEDSGSEMLTQTQVADDIGEFLNEEMDNVTTPSDFMAMYKLVDLHGRVVSEGIRSILSRYENLKPAEVAAAFGKDPVGNVAKLEKLLYHLTPYAPVPATRGQSADPHYADLDFGAGSQADGGKSKQRAAREKKEKVRAVTPERNDAEEDRNKDPTSLAVMSMHDKLRVAKTIPVYDLIYDRGDDFSTVASKIHILSILLDRQWARLVDVGKGSEDIVTFVAVNAAQKDPAAKSVLEEDAKYGQTWIIKLDEDLMKFLRIRKGEEV